MSFATIVVSLFGPTARFDELNRKTVEAFGRLEQLLDASLNSQVGTGQSPPADKACITTAASPWR